MDGGVHFCADVPASQQVWSFRVELRTCKSTRSPWGAWGYVETYKGEYGRALADAAALNNQSKNNQTRILETRIR